MRVWLKATSQGQPRGKKRNETSGEIPKSSSNRSENITEQHRKELQEEILCLPQDWTIPFSFRTCLFSNLNLKKKEKKGSTVICV